MLVNRLLDMFTQILQATLINESIMLLIERPVKVKTSGYIFVCLAWGLIISLTLFCFIKILRSGNQIKSNDTQE